MEVMSAREAAGKWGISQRRVAVLCSEKRIAGAALIGNMWIIPKNTPKPVDARTTRYHNQPEMGVRPFLKWAGGKGQLLKELEKYYPFAEQNVTRYVEPFVGGGAVLFDILSRYQLDEVYINDINRELINTYFIVRDKIEILLPLLKGMQDDFIKLNSVDRKAYYIGKRYLFNALQLNEEGDNVHKAALMIFLNKTCFNGLFRVNKQGLFNVPMGAYKAPLIYDEVNLRNVSEKLKKVRIMCGDYSKVEKFVDERTFVYIDPPYRPISNTSNFTAYTENVFTDNEQLDLARFVNHLHEKGAKILVSNSDPKNVNSEDNFFDDIYSNFHIKRVAAARMINSKSEGRGRLNELMISNF